MNTHGILHTRFNANSDQIPPVQIKKFKRKDLSLLFAELGFKRGVEIGVAEGIHALELCECIPGLELYCVDPYVSYHWKRSQERHEKDMLTARNRLLGYNATFIRKQSINAYHMFNDGELDFIFVDGDHSFDQVMLDLILWYPKIRDGGILSGHDYYRFRGAGVVNAVDAYTTAHQVHEWFVCDEREASYFWSKE